MYHTCIFCHSDLGANESIEEFPVGRRLAFDAVRGRLWVVCRTCERWNLSPLEERWEAVEAMERLFSETRLRVSTEHIGLARLAEGTELVRIGAPQRPEMAAWRYGDQFGRRRNRAFVRAGLGLGAVGLVLGGGLTAGVSIGAFGGLFGNFVNRAIKGNPDAVVARLGNAGEPIPVKRKDLDKVKLCRADSGREWRLMIKLKHETLEYTGDEALVAGGKLLPPMNRFGGNRSQVKGAVEILERNPLPLDTFAHAAKLRSLSAIEITKLEYPVRLALEMAAHEEQERRALEGELALLEGAWREAESVAAIADRLLVPESVQHAFDRIRSGLRRD